METIGWIDALPAGGRARFDPSIRTAADLVGAPAAPPAHRPVTGATPLWPAPVGLTTDDLAAVSESAA